MSFRGMPFFATLSAEDIERIDEASRKILRTVGIRVHDAATRESLKRAGALVEPEGEIVKFDGSWLDETLALAPSEFVLYSRDGRHDVPLGVGKVNFANGGRVFQILDLGTRGYRPTMLRDIMQSAKLVDKLDNIQFYIVSCQAHDIGPEHYHLNDFYHALNHTTKHVMGGCDNIEGARQMWELVCLIAGGEEELREKPFVSVITNMISPLTRPEYPPVLLRARNTGNLCPRAYCRGHGARNPGRYAYSNACGIPGWGSDISGLYPRGEGALRGRAHGHGYAYDGVYFRFSRDVDDELGRSAVG